MGRHASPSTSRRRPSVAPRLVVAVGVVLLVAVGAGVWLSVGHRGSASGCGSSGTVRVAVAPELAPTARELLAGPVRAGTGTCVTATVTAQGPLETVGTLGALAPAALPQVWVPDSSVWVTQAQGAQVQTAGPMASSPVVLATSRAAAADRGWSGTAPTWRAALTGARPVALPDLSGSAAQLSALGAVRASADGGAAADDATVQVVLASGRAAVASTADALATDRQNGTDAPAVPASEQQVLAADRADSGAPVVAVYPADGSPSLDYPVVRVGRASAAPAGAVDAVVRTLTSTAAHTAVRAAGFRDPAGNPPTGAAADVAPAALPKTVSLPPAALGALLQQLTTLAKPSRLLTVVDVSTSMDAAAGSGSRVTLARDALKSALALLPDSYAGGVWDFAYRLQDAQDWQQLAPIAPFGSAVAGGGTQRQLIDQQFDSLPTRLRPGGTALYDTTLAAVRASRAAFDPAAVNSVVLITDGRNEDDQGIGLDALLSSLTSEADPSRPVKVVAIGIGPDADMSALNRIADTTGGAAYQAVDPADLQKVLFDAIRRRTAS
jgi:Ca-activated chloride channel homolog